MLGFLIQWSTLFTLAVFPVLLLMYIYLARQEECEALKGFGEAYRDYARRVPAFRAPLGGSARIGQTMSCGGWPSAACWDGDGPGLIWRIVDVLFRAC
jgi:hypothetical protein